MVDQLVKMKKINQNKLRIGSTIFFFGLKNSLSQMISLETLGLKS